MLFRSRRLGRDGIETLRRGDGPKRCNAQRLGVAASEEPRTVGAWEQPDLYGDRADLVDLAAIESNPLFQCEVACGLLVHPPEEVLSDTRLAARGFEERLRFTLAASGGTDRFRDFALQRLEACRQLSAQGEE